MKIFLSFSISFLIASAIFLFLPKHIFAVTVTITNYPSQISTEPFNVDVYISGPNPGTNYLRVDLYKEGTTNYFGETFNGTSWYWGSDGTQYFPVTIGSGSTASATLQGRVGNPSSSEYPGQGNFKLRIRRYTSSGNPASGDQQTPVDVQINVPISTPTPTPIPTPTNTPTPGPTNTPTLTPTPKPPTPTPTQKPTSTLASTPTPTATSAPIGEVLGEETMTPTPTQTETPTKEKQKRNLLPFILIGSGFLLLVGSAVPLVLPKLKRGGILKKDEFPKID